MGCHPSGHPEGCLGFIAFSVQHLGLGQHLLEVGERVVQKVVNCVIGHCNTLGHASVEEVDHLEVELGTNPHGVGIDQFLADVGATVAPPTLNDTFKGVISTRLGFNVELFGQLSSLPIALIKEGVAVPLQRLPSKAASQRCLVEIVEAVAAFAVGLDVGAVDDVVHGVARFTGSEKRKSPEAVCQGAGWFVQYCGLIIF